MNLKNNNFVDVSFEEKTIDEERESIMSIANLKKHRIDVFEFKIQSCKRKEKKLRENLKNANEIFINNEMEREKLIGSLYCRPTSEKITIDQLTEINLEIKLIKSESIKEESCIKTLENTCVKVNNEVGELENKRNQQEVEIIKLTSILELPGNLE